MPTSMGSYGYKLVKDTPNRFVYERDTKGGFVYIVGEPRPDGIWFVEAEISTPIGNRHEMIAESTSKKMAKQSTLMWASRQDYSDIDQFGPRMDDPTGGYDELGGFR